MLITQREQALAPTQLFTFSATRKYFIQQQENVEAWIEALRSGNYKRNKSNLLRDEEGYSPLGVAIMACRLINKQTTARLEQYDLLGLTTSTGSCYHLYEDESTGGYGNDLLTIPEYYDFNAIAKIIEDRFHTQVKGHDLYLELIEQETDVELFDKDRLNNLHTTEMIRANITNWLCALRDRKYRQAQNRLRVILWEANDQQDREEVYGYCCLGLAKEVCNLDESSLSVLQESHGELGLNYQNGRFNLTPEQHEKLRTTVADSFSYSLTTLNDELDWNFRQIANFVEKQFKIITSTNGIVSKQG